MDNIEIQTLKIKIDKTTTLELTVPQARKLAEALLELFPTKELQAPLIIEQRNYWPYRYWGYGSSADIMFCNIEG